jgi:hypothetical protein
LEVALQESHSFSSTNAHPLLAQDLINLTKEDAMTDDSNSTSDDAQDKEEMIALAFGSLVRGSRGEFATYLGPSAASAWLLEVSSTISSSFSQVHSVTAVLIKVFHRLATRLQQSKKPFPII